MKIAYKLIALARGKKNMNSQHHPVHQTIQVKPTPPKINNSNKPTAEQPQFSFYKTQTQVND